MKLESLGRPLAFPYDNTMTLQTANSAWLRAITTVNQWGEDTNPRGLPIRETINFTSAVSMQYPVVTARARKLSYRFMIAEALWIMSGDDTVEGIAKYAPKIAQFSDDGVRFFGAYGPRISQQIRHVEDSLKKDPNTRQAVLNIWRENPPQTKDYPCTTNIQWLIRNGELHCVDTMRSSDLWLGWPYDIFNFTVLSACLALRLRNRGVEVERLGVLHLNAGSQHIYHKNFEGINNCIRDRSTFDEGRALLLDDFDSEIDFIGHLLALRDGKLTTHGWLEGFFS